MVSLHGKGKQYPWNNEGKRTVTWWFYFYMYKFCEHGRKYQYFSLKFYTLYSPNRQKFHTLQTLTCSLSLTLSHTHKNRLLRRYTRHKDTDMDYTHWCRHTLHFAYKYCQPFYRHKFVIITMDQQHTGLGSKIHSSHIELHSRAAAGSDQGINDLSLAWLLLWVMMINPWVNDLDSGWS